MAPTPRGETGRMSEWQVSKRFKQRRWGGGVEGQEGGCVGSAVALVGMEGKVVRQVGGSGRCVGVNRPAVNELTELGRSELLRLWSMVSS